MLCCKICKHGMAHKANQAKYCDTCVPLVSRITRRIWNKNHPHIGQKAARTWYWANTKIANAWHRQWCKENPERCVWYMRSRREGLQKACPVWVDKSELARIYQERPTGLVVDHIIPLKSKTVCGLHVPWNLQYLTPLANNKKYNKVVA